MVKRTYPTPSGIFERWLVVFLAVSFVLGMAVMTSLGRLTFAQFFNLGEGLLWLGIALVIAIRTFRSKDGKRIGYGAAVSFALFGVSDFIEMRTGAWYSPWSLLALKAACVVSLLAHFIAYRKRQGRRAASDMPGKR